MTNYGHLKLYNSSDYDEMLENRTLRLGNLEKKRYDCHINLY